MFGPMTWITWDTRMRRDKCHGSSPKINRFDRRGCTYPFEVSFCAATVRPGVGESCVNWVTVSTGGETMGVCVGEARGEAEVVVEGAEFEVEGSELGDEFDPVSEVALDAPDGGETGGEELSEADPLEGGLGDVGGLGETGGLVVD